MLTFLCCLVLDHDQDFVARSWASLIPVTPWDEMLELLIKLHLLYKSNEGRLKSIQHVCIHCSSAGGTRLLHFIEHGLHNKGCLVVNGALHHESRVSMLNLEEAILLVFVLFEAGLELVKHG
jgi:hypothetical protein